MSWTLFWPAMIGAAVIGALAAGLWLRRSSPTASGGEDKMLADFAEKAPVGLLQMDAGGMIQWANLTQLEWLGRAREEVVGKNCAEFRAQPSEGPGLLARLAAGETLRDYPLSLRARDGSTRDVLIQSHAEFEHGRLLRVWLLSQDAAGLRSAEGDILRLNQELEQKVRERTAQLEAVNKELESFNYSVSHDLRAPLRALRGFSEVLLEVHASQLDSRGQDFLRRACAASFQMERLIEDLLKLAQVSRADLQLESVNLSSMAGDIASELAHSDATRSVQFVIAPECAARGDSHLIRVVLDNLLRNSWKFSGKRAEARIEFGKVDGQEPAFFVRDNGAGFDMAFSKKLFTVFQRLHAASEFPGTGVGLATVQRIINRHGGRAWAVGAVNEGATFYFTLPGTNGTQTPAPAS